MFKLLRKRLKSTQPEQQLSLEQAAAVLLLETAHADGVIDEVERQALQTALKSTFALTTDMVTNLLNDAERHLASSDGVYVFAKRLRKAWTVAQRKQLMIRLWAVVYADGRVDQYEESHLRQVAEQLGLQHAEYIQAKHAAIQ